MNYYGVLLASVFKSDKASRELGEQCIAAASSNPATSQLQQLPANLRICSTVILYFGISPTSASSLAAVLEVEDNDRATVRDPNRWVQIFTIPQS